MTDATTAADGEERQHTTLLAYVGLSAGSPAADRTLVDDSEEEATEMVDGQIGTAAKDRVPASVRRRAILEVGADLYWRKASRNGVVNFDSGEMQPMRLARDPMLTATSILRPYLVGLA